MIWIKFTLVTLWVFGAVIGKDKHGVQGACPAGCTCTVAKEKEAGETGKNVVCRGNANSQMYASIDHIQPEEDTLFLTVTGFAFKSIKKGSFQGLPKLTKLDLSHNELVSIEPGAFMGLHDLKKLNLSHNALGSINSSIFEGLTGLERLDLNDNIIKSLPEKSFSSLPQLQKLEFASPYLVCDCHLAWIVQWMRDNQVRILPSTTCSLPTDMRGRMLRKLKKQELHCEHILELAVFELSPNTQQVVFEGDKMPFQCHASATDEHTDVYWQRNQARVQPNATLGIILHKEDDETYNTVTSRLFLESARIEDSGVWTCVVQTPRGNVSRSVTITVIPSSSAFCPPVTRHTNKGILRWPKILAGLNPGVPCPYKGGATYQGDLEDAKAYHTCTLLGEWATLNTDECQYESQVTRILQQYAQADVHNVSGGVEKWAEMLMEYLHGGEEGSTSSRPLSDYMDVVYLAHIVDALSRQVTPSNKLADVVLHIVGMVMTTVSDTALTLAQHEHYALTSLVSSVERLGPQLLSTSSSLDNPTIQSDITAHRFSKFITVHVVRPGAVFTGLLDTPHVAPLDLSSFFRGVKCTVGEAPYNHNSLKCVEGGMEEERNSLIINGTMEEGENSGFVAEGEEEEEEKFAGSIHLPGSVIEDAQCMLPATSCNSSLGPILQFVSYSNAKLFPTEAGFQITSPVMSASIVGHALLNSSSPIVIRLPKPAHVSSPASTRVMYWDTVSRHWKQHGCRLVHDDNTAGGGSSEYVTAHCDHLTQFGLMTTVSVIGGTGGEGRSWLSEYFTMNPIVYAGSAILLLCLTITIFTYILSSSELKMPRKIRHCIPNICFAMLLLVVTFSFGARTTHPPLACQIVGIGLHYFSLCTLMWITILAYVLYKRLSKANRPPPPPNPESMDGPAPPKPILGLYLLGWGLAVIACGIVAAISLNHYTQDGQDYCFLAPEPRLLAFYAPAGVLALVIILLLFCMCHTVHGCRGEPVTSATSDPDTEEVTDIEEVESVRGNHNLNGSRSVASDDTIEDLEYRPVSQVRAVAVLLLLYAIVWVAGGFAVALPYPGFIGPYQELIFTGLYAVFSTILGVFIVVFYVFARHDCRICWTRACGCRNQSPEYEVSRGGSGGNNIRHVNGGISSHHHHHQIPQTLVHTTTSSIESHSVKSNHTNRSNGGGGQLKYSTAPLLPPQATNGNLTDSSMGQPEAYPNFYNPKQNGMAKKYWQKKRQKNLITRLNHELDSGNHSSQTEGGRSDIRNDMRNNMQLSVEINTPPTANGGVGSSQNEYYNSLTRAPFTIHTPPINHSHSQISPQIHNQISPKPPLPGHVGDRNFRHHPLPPLPDHIRMPYVPIGSGVETGSLQRKPPPSQSHNHLHGSLPRNGTLPGVRPRDFDGQSATSGLPNGGGDGRSSTSGGGIHNTESLIQNNGRPPPGVAIDVLTGLPENMSELDTTTTSIVLSPEQMENRQNEQKFTDPASFLAELQERIPTTSLHPPIPEANNNSSHADSDCTSSVMSSAAGNPYHRKHRHHHHRHGHHHHHKNHRNSRNKPSPRKWEDENPPDKTPAKPAVVYTFINHSYEDRVRQKLIQKQMSEPGSVPAIVTEQLLPRSVSAYNHDDAEDNIGGATSGDSDATSQSAGATSDSDSDDSDTQLWSSKSTLQNGGGVGGVGGGPKQNRPKKHHHRHHRGHHRHKHGKHKVVDKKETSV